MSNETSMKRFASLFE